jgi:hypothetical protein
VKGVWLSIVDDCLSLFALFQPFSQFGRKVYEIDLELIAKLGFA